MYIKFSKSPTGAFGLAYNVDETGFVEDELGKEVVKAGYGERVSKPEEAEESEKKPENRIDKNTKEVR